MRLVFLILGFMLFAEKSYAQSCGDTCHSNFFEENSPAAISEALKKLDPNSRSPRTNETILDVTLFYGLPEHVELLLKMGANPNARNVLGYTPLHMAGYNGSKKVELLLEWGAKVNARTVDGKTPLMTAASSNDNSAQGVVVLLEAGADLMARDRDGAHAIHYSAYNDTSEVVIFFLRAGIDVNIRNNDGNTPLHSAAYQDMWKASPLSILALLAEGADVTIKNYEGYTPWDIAADNKYLKNTDAYWALNEARFK